MATAAYQAINANGTTHLAMHSTEIQSPKKLNIGVIGVGRMGRQHTLNALHHVPQTKLVCVCDVLTENLKWAAKQLSPYGVKVYHQAEEMLQHPGLQAVIIASPTNLHHVQVIDCVHHGLHVLCEKPLSMNVQQTKSVLAIANEPKHTNLKVMTAYCRRFDKSYRNAVNAIREGKIGSPVVIRSENRDQYEDSEFYKNYLLKSPGIFIDSCVHDIDLTLAFLTSSTGVLPRPKSCSAIGTIALHNELRRTGDVDNGVGIVEWYPPAANAPAPISYYHVSRIQPHGFDNPTEITGTKGVLKINLHPRRDLIEFASNNGITNEVGPDFYDRYEAAFITELQTFANAVLNDKKLPYNLETALRGMEIAEALQESLKTGEKATWDEHGRRTDRYSGQHGLDHGKSGHVANGTMPNASTT